MMVNPCYSDLAGFYRKTEVAFLGRELNFKLMTPEQLDEAIEESITLYNELYPPPPKPKWRKYLNTGIQVGVVGGAAAVAGGAILASYGISAETAAAAASSAMKATAAKGSVLANVQKGASAVSAAGLVYGKVTGETPEDLVKAAELIKSPTAGDAMLFVAKDQLNDMGQDIQAGNKAANDALRERIKAEQQQMSDKLMQDAADKAAMQGRPPPPPASAKTPDMMQMVALATPFILFMLR